jgi:hypothetical protein
MQQQQQQDQQQPADTAAAAAAAGGSAAALAAAYASTAAAGAVSTAAANAAKRKAAEEAWAAVLSAMPVSGKGIKEVGSKALEMCNIIGPQKVVRAVLEQMSRWAAAVMFDQG